jgi:hypothetical protein
METNMNLRILMFTASVVSSFSSMALEAECDQPSSINGSPGGRKSLLLPGGGHGSYTGYSWEALTLYPDGRIDHPNGVTIEWEDDKKSLTLKTTSQVWSDNSKEVTCYVQLD